MPTRFKSDIELVRCYARGGLSEPQATVCRGGGDGIAGGIGRARGGEAGLCAVKPLDR